HGLIIRSVHLKQACKRQKTIKGIVALKACQHHREIAIGQRQHETIPSARSSQREFDRGPIFCSYAKFVQCAAIISAKPFKEVVGKPPILRRSVGELMPGKMVQSVRNENVLVNVKRCCDSLCEDIRDVIIGVAAVVKLGAKSTLPFLS